MCWLAKRVGHLSFRNRRGERFAGDSPCWDGRGRWVGCCEIRQVSRERKKERKKEKKKKRKISSRNSWLEIYRNAMSPCLISSHSVSSYLMRYLLNLSLLFRNPIFGYFGSWIGKSDFDMGVLFCASIHEGG
jgi:hypothetical protein